MKVQAYKTLAIICTSIILLTSCKDAEINVKKHPFVIMDDVEVLEDGAVFQAEVTSLGQQEIISHGFVWRLIDESKSTSGIKKGVVDQVSEIWFKTELIKPISVGLFSDTVNSDLLKGKDYLVRPFIETNINTVYGTSVEYTSRGSKLPEILNYSPKEGFDGTVVKMAGKYFSSRSGSVSVFVENIEAKVIRSTEDSLIFKIPNSDFIGSSHLKIEIGDKEIFMDNFFAIQGPVILSVSKNIGKAGDILIIEGENFINNAYKENLDIDISLDGNSSYILNYSDSFVEFFVPSLGPLYENGNTQIVLTSGSKSASVNFTIEKQWEDITTLSGFYPEGQEMLIFDSNDKGYAYKQGTNTVYKYDEIENNWINTGNTSINTIRGGFVTSLFNKTFRFGGEVYQQGSKSLCLFNSENNTWLQKPDMPFEVLRYYAYFIIENSVYIILNDQSVWKFDAQTELFSKLGDFPVSHGEAVGFSIDGVGYIVIHGRTFSYNEQNDLWLEVSTNIFSKSSGVKRLFDVYHSDGIVLFNRDFYKYNVSNDLWLKVSRLPEHTSISGAFRIKGELYLAQFWGGYSNPIRFYKFTH